MLRRRRPSPTTEPEIAAPPPAGEAASPTTAPATPAPVAVRWTEHGPEAPPARETAPPPPPAPRPPADHVPPSLAMADHPVDVAPIAGVPAAAPPEPYLAMPSLPDEAPPPAPAVATAAPAVPPTLATPSSETDEVDAAEPAAEDLDAIRARLAARGLVRTERSVRIRDIAGGRPDAPPAPIVPDKGDPFLPAPAPEDAVGDDAEALEPEPFGPTATTRCPSCRSTQQVAVDATGYRCDTCDRVWRWGVCTSCSHLSLTIARQESWRCTDCGAYSRSWWRTVTATREAQEVTRRKRADAAEREHQRILAVARRRRWKLILAGVVVVLLAGASALIFSSTDASSPAEQTRATCANWTRLKSDIANGALSATQLDTALADLAADAELANPDVQLAADRLSDAGRPGDATFLVASTQLSDACAASR